MNSKFRVTIPGKSWAVASQNIQEEIKKTSDNGEDFPIAKVFDFITLTDSNRDLEEKLIKRGLLKIHADGYYKNKGIPIARAIHDIHQNIGRMGIYFPRELSVKITDDLRLSVDKKKQHRIVLSFRDKPPTAGFGRRFTLHEILFEDKGVSYIFIDQSNIDRSLIMFVDFSKEPNLSDNPAEIEKPLGLQNLNATKGVQIASIVTNEAFADGPCDCCVEPRRRQPLPCEDPGGELIVRIHAKVLVEPIEDIQTQVTAVNTVYGEQIKCILDSTEVLNTTDLDIKYLEDYNAGECATSEEDTGELSEISNFRDNATELDIVVYWVRSIISTNGSLAGCATSLPNKPTCVMARSTSEWVLAHELGHVLGLKHPCQLPGCAEELRSRLMYPSDNFLGTPEIIGKELKTMRCSPYTISEEKE